MQELTTTSYAILGLLALQPWTTYELAKQMEVSLRNFWPRAERKLYDEPKKLVEHGFAEVTREMVGRRPRSRYRITPEGRQALQDWLDEPGAMPVLEFEALVKVFFAEQGNKDQLLTTLQGILRAARHRERTDSQWAAYYLATGGRFAGRTPVVALVGKLQTELNHTLATWAEWAYGTASAWPDDLTEAPVPDDVLRDIAAGATHEGDANAPPPAYDDTTP